MAKNSKKTVAQVVKETEQLSAAQRLERVTLADGSGEVFIWHPANPNSKAVLRPYKGVCRETGTEFILYRSQVRKGDAWVDPVVDLYPPLMAERAAKAEQFRQERDAVVNAYPPEVKAALGLK